MQQIICRDFVSNMDSGPKRLKANDGEGKFRKLPEPLIIHILSFLSTKAAARTSVLSKKWRYRWTCITKLVLDDEELVLEMTSCAILVPETYVYFGQLKFLKLSHITFTLDSSSNSGSLRLSFPVLKRFETERCTWSIEKGIIFEAPLLETVDIYQNKYESYEPGKCTFKFLSTCLKEFTYYDHVTQDILLLDPSLFHNASADISFFNFWDKDVENRKYDVLLLKQFC
ncbi:hypothetical protein RIF29_38886 [Crotalaria pallida]|uniref:F-box domain-containing protein n=1 Tax=Crotalaria pallida TaxID=3830 RepID=A0AAN9HST1_CROPI